MKSVDLIKQIVDSLPEDCIIVSTCGHTSRELFNAGDRKGNFYMVGGMGGASAFALGIALSHPDKRVIVLDGDGAVAMRFGNIFTIHDMNLKNLTHITLKNGCFASTGEQPCTKRVFTGFPTFNVEPSEKVPRPTISLRDNFKRLYNFLNKNWG